MRQRPMTLACYRKDVDFSRLGTLALLATGVILIVGSGPGPSAVPVVEARKPPDAAGLGSGSTGLTMTDGLLEVSDPTKFFAHVAAVTAPVFVIGASPTAEAVLIAIISARFPDRKWPPEQGTAAAQQWAMLIKRVDDVLHKPAPSPPRLRVVT